MKSRNRVLYYGKKAAAFLASVLLLSVLVFYISRLAPGDPLVSYYGDRVEKMTPEERAWAEEKLGLKDPISVQYIRWAGNALQGDFGISYKYKMDVTRVIEGRIGNTLVLGGIGFLLIFTLALLLEFSVHGRKILGWTASSVRWEPSRDVFRNSGCRCF